MAKKSRKRVIRRPAKKSWWEKLFTIPKLAVFGFIALSVFTIYQVTLPTRGVEGVSASDDDMAIITEEEANAIAAAGSKSPYTVHQVDVFLDKNSDAKWDEFKEDCYFEDVRLYADNGTKVKNFDPVSGCSDPIRVKTKARTITIGIKAINGYKDTGLTYSDKNYTNRTIKNVSKQKVTAWADGYPQTRYLTYIQFGIKKK